MTIATANLTLAGSLGWNATIHVVQMADGHYEPEAMARDAAELHRILRHALPGETYHQLKRLMRMEMVQP